MQQIKIYPLSLTLKSPFKTAHGTTLQRPITLVAITLTNGVTGYGEIQSFIDDQYVPETHMQSLQMVQRMARQLISLDFDTPQMVSNWLTNSSHLSFAKSAVEMAFWDAYGKQVKQPLWSMIGGQEKQIAVSSVIGIQDSWQQTQAVANNLIGQGYQRIKIKIDQQTDITSIKKLLAQFPEQMFSLDANASWSIDDIARLKTLDHAGLALIEQPFPASA